jgi:hypothetical protein
MLPGALVREVNRHQEEVLAEAEERRRPDQWRRGAVLSDTKLDGHAASKEHDPFAFMDLPV